MPKVKWATHRNHELADIKSFTGGNHKVEISLSRSVVIALLDSAITIFFLKSRIWISARLRFQ